MIPERAKELIIMRNFLTREEKRELDSYLQTCPECKEFLDEDEKLGEMLSLWADSLASGKKKALISPAKVLLGAALLGSLLFLPFLWQFKGLISGGRMKGFRGIRETVLLVDGGMPDRVVSLEVLPEDVLHKGQEMKVVAWETLIPGENFIEVEVRK